MFCFIKSHDSLTRASSFSPKPILIIILSSFFGFALPLLCSYFDLGLCSFFFFFAQCSASQAFQAFGCVIYVVCFKLMFLFYTPSLHTKYIRFQIVPIINNISFFYIFFNKCYFFLFLATSLSFITFFFIYLSSFFFICHISLYLLKVQKLIYFISKLILLLTLNSST